MSACHSWTESHQSGCSCLITPCGLGCDLPVDFHHSDARTHCDPIAINTAGQKPGAEPENSLSYATNHSEEAAKSNWAMQGLQTLHACS
eukprot:363259-Chlamydomonas_euryale.AAC.2